MSCYTREQVEAAMASKDLVINEFIYDSFLFITLGSFGIAEIGKIFGDRK
jgi:hypothetical protein